MFNAVSAETGILGLSSSVSYVKHVLGEGVTGPEQEKLLHVFLRISRFLKSHQRILGSN